MADFKISLAAARVNANMTQEQAANAINVSKATIYSWENGKSKIPFESLVNLCNVYKFPIDYIFVPSSLT